MLFSRHLRRAGKRILAAIAVLVMSVAALAPALANALGHSSPVMWVELCSAEGKKRIAVDESGAPLDGAQQNSGLMAEHCPFCHIEHSPANLPPALAPLVPQPIALAAFPALFYAAARPLYAWAPSRSRGPPALS
jgi:hypothetical protein